MSAEPGFGGTLAPGARLALVSIDLMRAHFERGSLLRLPGRACLDAARH